MPTTFFTLLQPQTAWSKNSKMSSVSSHRVRTARHAADMPMSNLSAPVIDSNEVDADSVFRPYRDLPTESDSAFPRRRLVSIRILPARDVGDGSLTSDKIAQAIMQQANDPQSKLRNTPGLQGILGAFLAPRGIDPGSQSNPEKNSTVHGSHTASLPLIFVGEPLNIFYMNAVPALLSCCDCLCRGSRGVCPLRAAAGRGRIRRIRHTPPARPSPRQLRGPRRWRIRRQRPPAGLVGVGVVGGVRGGYCGVGGEAAHPNGQGGDGHARQRRRRGAGRRRVGRGGARGGGRSWRAHARVRMRLQGLVIADCLCRRGGGRGE